MFGTALHAQRESEHWYFGNKAGLLFATEDPTPLTDGAMIAHSGCASISDAQGRLLFYSNGKNVWDKHHNIMPNGADIGGSDQSYQACLIIPMPGSATKYYVIVNETLEEVGTVNQRSLTMRYAIVDVTLNGGAGDVTVRGQDLLENSAERVTAIRHANGVDVWLIGCVWYTDTVAVFRITPNGINTTPTKMAMGGGRIWSSHGVMKSNRQGTRIAVGVSRYHSFQPMPGEQIGLTLYRFDRATGVLSNEQVLSNGRTYGIEFSPDGRRLYASGIIDALEQYDLTVPDYAIAGTRVEIGTPYTSASSALQLAPNGRIYAARYNAAYVGEIRFPNELGDDCGYTADGVYLAGRLCQWGLPEMLNSVLFQESEFAIVATNGCAGDTVPFVAEPIDSIQSITWNFGDPASGPANTSRTNPARHVYNSAGTYTVSASITAKDGRIMLRQTTVEVGSRPVAVAGPDLWTCKGLAKVLQGTGNARFSWSPGNVLDDSTLQRPTAILDTTTTFILTAYGAAGCVTLDTVTVFVASVDLRTSTDTTICSGGTARLRTEGADTYEWWPDHGLSATNGSSVFASPTTTTRYYVVGRTGQCTDTVSILVSVLPRVQLRIAPLQPSTCAGVPITLQAFGANSYQWYAPDGTTVSTDSIATVAPSITTRYTVVGTSHNGCSDTANIVVHVATTLTVDVPPHRTICSGESTTLTCSTPGTIVWTNALTGTAHTGSTITVSPTQTTWYYIAVENEGCMGLDSTLITVQHPPALITAGNNTICVGDTAILWARGATFYRWSPTTYLENARDSVTRAWPPTTTEYTITAWNVEGCISTTTITVYVQTQRPLSITGTSISGSVGNRYRGAISVSPGYTVSGTVSVTLQVPVEAAVVTIVPTASVVSVVETVKDRTNHIACVIDAAHANTELLQFDAQLLLSGFRDNSIAVVAVPSSECWLPGEAIIDLHAEHCATIVRAVRFLTATSPAVVARRNSDSNIECEWWSGTSGTHTVEVATITGERLAIRHWTRGATDATSGSTIINSDGLAQGAFLVRLCNASGCVGTLLW